MKGEQVNKYTALSALLILIFILALALIGKSRAFPGCSVRAVLVGVKPTLDHSNFIALDKNNVSSTRYAHKQIAICAQPISWDEKMTDVAIGIESLWVR